jgi:predicted dehydrogenase
MAKPNKPTLIGDYMKILFIGLGSIGQRHAKIISQYFPDIEIYAYSAKTRHNISHITTINSWSKIKKIDFEIAFICNITSCHIDSAIKCALQGMHLFLEKPISTDLNKVENLCKILTEKKLSCYVAYPFVHHSGINQFKLALKYVDALTIECDTNIERWGKKSYSFDKKTGGGVLYELSHEIYLADYLFGPIIDMNAILAGHEKYNINSTAIIRLKFKNYRNLIVLLDLNSDADDCRSISYCAKNDVVSIFDGNTYHKFYYCPTQQMYIDQIKYFLQNYKNARLQNNIWEMLPVFEKIVEIEKGQ